MERKRPPESGSMLTIGLLGGMSWVSSAEYYRIINERVRETLGSFHSARCLLYSVDFADVERLQVEERWAEAGELLGDAAEKLQSAGADLLVLCTNTMHKVADRIQAAVQIPLLHLADVTVAAVRKAGMSRVGLLGTAYTMEQLYYRDRLERQGLDVIIPPPQDRGLLHQVIFDELVKGVFTRRSRERYRDIIERLAGMGAQGVILGCTEIELLLADQISPLPTFPTTRLHAEAAVAAALAPSTTELVPTSVSEIGAWISQAP
ncbi:MAG: aspartate/glutamate racemase family protein [Terriglobales bacterium]